MEEAIAGCSSWKLRILETEEINPKRERGGNEEEKKAISLAGGFREIGTVVYEQHTQPWSGAETSTELCTRCKCRRIVRCRRRAPSIFQLP